MRRAAHFSHIWKKKKQGRGTPAHAFGLLSSPARDGFDFEEVFDTPDTAFAAIAGLFHAAKG